MKAEISQRKLAANRRNAQLSSGPRSARGKARARRNAVRHGLAVSFQNSPSLPHIKAIADAIYAAGATPSRCGEVLALAESEYIRLMTRAAQAKAIRQLIMMLAPHSSSAQALRLQGEDAPSPVASERLPGAGAYDVVGPNREHVLALIEKTHRYEKQALSRQRRALRMLAASFIFGARRPGSSC